VGVYLHFLPVTTHDPGAAAHRSIRRRFGGMGARLATATNGLTPSLERSGTLWNVGFFLPVDPLANSVSTFVA